MMAVSQSFVLVSLLVLNGKTAEMAAGDFRVYAVAADLTLSRG